jgi:peptidoglycan/xylan/chitin deacetylase (PgdA/CDA1 family)
MIFGKKIMANFNSIKKIYFNWRYWNNVYSNMLKQTGPCTLKENHQIIPYKNKPGVVLSFDDSYRINDWYKYGKEIFGYYDVKVTFNINSSHHFEGKREHTQDEIDMLIDLQSNGHEIAHHGYNHKRANEYSNEFGVEEWIKDEIVSLFNWMDLQSHSRTFEKFKKPVTFAFPHFVYNNQHILELVPKYFKIVRGHLDKDNLTSFNHSGFTPSICLDGYYSHNLHFIKKIMRLAKKSGKNLILTCHSILPEEVNWEDFGWGEEAKKSGTWRTSPETIRAIIEQARKLDLEFYTTAEIAGVATFIDPNFEKCVRELLHNPSVDWIPISDLLSIKELDLSNRQISNLDGIQYFLNLERIDLGGNSITDFRILEKLPKITKVNLENPLKEESNLESTVI